MSERLDAMIVRESNGSKFWTKIGAAFPSRQGDGYTVVLDAMPASVDGQYRILLMVPKPKEDRRAPQSSGWGNDDLGGDGSPF